MTGTPIEAGLTFEAVLLAVGSGISVPLLASILPIQGALSRSLTDSLDTKRSKIIAIEAKISRAGLYEGWGVRGGGGEKKQGISFDFIYLFIYLFLFSGGDKISFEILAFSLALVIFG